MSPDHLKARLATHLSVVDPGTVDADGLARAEQDDDRVLLVADGVAAGSDHSWRDFCLRQADAVVLVARAGSGVPTRSRHSASSRTWWSSAPCPRPRSGWPGSPPPTPGG